MMGSCKEIKAKAKSGWMPLWWGNKFNKRLAQKRLRQKQNKDTEERNAL